MILTYAALALGFVLPASSILLDMAHDNEAIRDERDIARITAPLPPVRDLSGWPEPLSPLDLPGIGHTETLAATELDSRTRYKGRHRVGAAVGAQTQRARWDSPTGQFHLLIEAGWSDDERQTLSREWWCSPCLDDHRDCSGICACPCTLVGV